MAKSKNDINNYQGGTARITVRKTVGKCEVKLTLIDPDTSRPYTYSHLFNAFIERKEKYPSLARLVDTQMDSLRAKAMQNPDSEFCRVRILHPPVKSNPSDDSENASFEKQIQKAKKELLKSTESLACLLYRDRWESNVKSGSVTIRQYFDYKADYIFPDGPLRPLKGLVERYLLPHVGDTELANFGKDAQNRCIEKINRQIKQEKKNKNMGNTKAGNIVRGCDVMFKELEHSGYEFTSSPSRLADLLDPSYSQNRALLDASRIKHLDEPQRHNLFDTLLRNNQLREAFLMALIYAGMSLNEISAFRFADFVQLNLQDNQIFCLFIDRYMRKSESRYSTISAANDQFTVHKLRWIVLPPWAADILLLYVETLRKQGVSPEQLACMRLSDKTPNGNLIHPHELADVVQSLIPLAGIAPQKIPRTDDSGKVTLKNMSADVDLLYNDAKYVARELCGMDDIMMHSMFGTAFTTTDEASYLDYYSPMYNVSRYLHSRRYSPIDVPASEPSSDTLLQSSDAYARDRYLLRIQNPTEQEQTLHITADYAIRAYWKKK